MQEKSPQIVIESILPHCVCLYSSFSCQKIFLFNEKLRRSERAFFYRIPYFCIYGHGLCQ